MIPHDSARVVAATLSRNNDKVVDSVEKTINDPRGYLIANRDRFDFWDSPHDVDPLFAAYESLVEHQFVGYIDWRSFPDESRDAAAPMFEKKGVHDFDWTFIDEFMDADEPIDNDKLLNIIAERVSDLPGDHIFVWLFIESDNYYFTVVTKSELELLKPIRNGRFEVKRRFQPLG